MVSRLLVRVLPLLLLLSLLPLLERWGWSSLFLSCDFLSVRSADFLFDFSLLSLFGCFFLILLSFLYFLQSDLFLRLLEKVLSKAIELALKAVL